MAIRARRLLALVALAATTPLAACAGFGNPSPRSITEWKSLAANGWPAETVAVVQISTPPNPEWSSVGYIGFVSREGSTEFVKVGASQGILAGNGDTVCAATSTTGYRFGPEAAEQWPLRGSQGEAVFARVRQDGTCLAAFNSGLIDVVWQRQGGFAQSRFPEPVESVGADGSIVWGLEIVPTSRERRLFRLDTRTGQLTTSARFKDWQTGLKGAWSYKSVSQLAPYRRRLFYLSELMVRIDEVDHQFRPGKTTAVRLMSIDPATGRTESTPIDYTDGTNTQLADASFNSGGHLHGRDLLTITSDGSVRAIDLRTRRARTLMSLSERARTSKLVAANAGWHGRELTLFYLTDEGEAYLEKYDVYSGERLLHTSVEGLAPLVVGTELSVSSVAGVDA